MNVLILDAHPNEDARIDRHINYLLEQKFNVYRIKINYLSDSSKPGPFSKFGEKSFRINLLDFHGKIRTLIYLKYCLGKKSVIECLNGLKSLNFSLNNTLIIHVHNPELLPLAQKLAKKYFCKAKIVYDRHEVYEKLVKNFGISIPILYEKMSKKIISGVIVVSEYHSDKTKQLFPDSIVAIVPNYPLSTEYDNQLINAKIKSFSQDSEITMIYIGGLNNYADRDVDLLLKIGRTCLSSNDRVKFLIGGTFLDPESKLNIERMSQKFGNRFQFLGYVPRQTTIQLTQNSHIGFFLVRPRSSYWVKTSPNKIYEYLMCGTIPIYRADVDHADKLRNCSLSFKRSDSDDSIINAVLDLLNKPEKMKMDMKNAKEISVRFTWESVACRYVDLYRLLLPSS